ncbi:1,6-anhydro-N-acetylmuramyl-L-alanine amidase AmpD [Candidatus Thiothrix sp. Deng01]|uniref:1,6-anhydro-N-acetylmuramyl-L-alanine amidase AmpD n=1 Tax=Candidatus Thiothrix phosphatis TaxID=3112415 RepID=A0ABU6D1G9_9GAMM|nr:1,6-anhydro-N-acetylmuramyl-L-alanine amidase AmpD [Candidatus Thiothrix sp. Deng01]MEB4592905.1 1,6-anhydro-N-acetylmuramyl-L-alanine amidase AmpD [Candidatus Thiothrix sp. Deng01]
MKIDAATGLLDVARQQPSPNYDERPENCAPELIVLHNISLPPYEFGGPWIDQLFTNQLDPEAHPFFREICHLRVASHLLVRRDGELVQYVPFHKRAFHAGVSSYRGRSRCNDFSVGVEIEGSDFAPFTEAQYQQLEALLPALTAAYPSLSLRHVTGHEHIAPGRKTDPGPFFDWGRLSKTFNVELPAL